MQTLTLKELKGRVSPSEMVDTLLHVQVANVHSKTTKEGKPYYEVHFIDHSDRILLRAWSDAPVYLLCDSLEDGHCVELSGEFSHHATFGLDARRWQFRPLNSSEKAALMGGPREIRERQDTDFQFIAETVQSLVDPRLRIGGRAGATR